jgi:hypothetical protein
MLKNFGSFPSVKLVWVRPELRLISDVPPTDTDPYDGMPQ